MTPVAKLIMALRPNQITGANACGPVQSAMRTPCAARVAQFCRSAVFPVERLEAQLMITFTFRFRLLLVLLLASAFVPWPVEGQTKPKYDNTTPSDFASKATE